MRRSPLLLWLLTLVLVAGPSWAANPRATALARQGQAAYDAGKYKEAAELLNQAYELEPNPVLLFNMARAYDQAGELQTALDTYRQYVSKSGAEPELVKRSNLAMDRLRGLIAKADADKQVNEAERKRLESEASASRARAEAEAEKARLQKLKYEDEERERQAKASDGASTRTIASLAVGGVGVVGLGVGIGMGVAALGSKSGFTNATTVADKKRFESSAKTQALVADICIGVGVAAAIAALVLFPWGTLGSPEKSVSVAFVPSNSGGFFSLGGSF